MKNDLALLTATPVLPAFAPNLTPEAIAEKDAALAGSALIGKVANREQNDLATEARKRLKSLSRGLDKRRKELTEPFVEIQRALIRSVEPHIQELDREDGRLENLMKDFKLAEDRRIREEQEAQQRELERIERERQAELDRIRREAEVAEAARQAEIRKSQEEQARKEREAREAREAAERAAREATNKKQREEAARQAEAAEAARKEADKAAAEAAAKFTQNQELSKAAQVQETAALERVNENADARAQVESKPVEITRSAGQVVKKKWKITQINDALLFRSHPYLAREVKWDRLQITELLNSGVKLPGVTAEEDFDINIRGRTQRTIEV